MDLSSLVDEVAQKEKEAHESLLESLTKQLEHYKQQAQEHDQAIDRLEV